MTAHGTMPDVNERHMQCLNSPDWARYLATEVVPWVTSEIALGDHLLEIGPGPGLMTDVFRPLVEGITALEYDETLASTLADRMAGSNVRVIHGDATQSGLPSAGFSAATCFAVLHHVPSAELQDQLFAEVRRLLRPGGAYIGEESRDTPLLRAGHEDDVFVPLDPESLPDRLRAAGFSDVRVDVLDDYRLRFVARV